MNHYLDIEETYSFPSRQVILTRELHHHIKESVYNFLPHVMLDEMVWNGMSTQRLTYKYRSAVLKHCWLVSINCSDV